jgi:hypothetical protein
MASLRYTLDPDRSITVQFPMAGRTVLHKVVVTGNPGQSFASLRHTSFISTRPLSRYKIPYFKYDFESYKILARVTGCHSLCSYAESQSGSAYALKLVVDVENCVEQGWAAERLFQEAEFYSVHLQQDQGRAVPFHYGLWGAKTVWGGTIILAVLEWCGVPWSVLRDSQYDTLDRR